MFFWLLDGFFFGLFFGKYFSRFDFVVRIDFLGFNLFYRIRICGDEY